MVTLIPIANLKGDKGDTGDDGTGGGISGLITPMDSAFGATGDGVANDQGPLEACWEAAGELNAMVLIDRPYAFSDKLKHYGGMGVIQVAMPKILAVPTGPEPGLIAIEDTAWYQYGDGADGSGSANDNPGPIRGLYIDGAGIAGGGDGLFVMDSAQSSLMDLWVSNSIGIGVHVGRSQNNNFFNLQVGGCAGVGLMLKALVLGQQGPGHNLFFGGHLHDCYLPIHVTSNGPTDFFYPHDNVFQDTLVETGRVVDQPIRAAAVLDSGQTQFNDVNFTFGAQVGPTNPVEEDCSILVDNPHYTAYSTVVGINGGSVGGGSNGVTDGIRIKQSGAANIVRIGDNVGWANVDNKFCADGIVLGASDPLISIGFNDREVTGSIANYRKINGSTSLNAYRKTWMGTIFEKIAGIANGLIQNPLVIKYEDEAYSRFSIDWNGLQRYTDPTTGATIGSTLRSGALWGVTGRWGVAGSMYRTPALITMAADGALSLNWETNSAAIVSFTVGGADATSVALVSTTVGAVPADGQELMIGFAGTGTNVIDWSAAGITFVGGVGPQPIAGVLQFLTIVYRSGLGWFERSRSHQAASTSVAANTKTINPQTGTNYQPVLGDAGLDKLITMNNAAASTLTIPTNATTAFPVGTVIEFSQIGAGQVTITPAGGVVINGDPGLKIAARYGFASLVKIATDTWLATGRLSA